MHVVLIVALENDEVTVTEGSRRVDIVIKKIGTSERPVSVRVITKPGTAIG